MKTSLGPKTFAYPTPVFIVGTYDAQGHPNAMAVAWGGICCSKPPCVAISVRKATYTYGNLVERKAFTVSIPHRITWLPPTISVSPPAGMSTSSPLPASRLCVPSWSMRPTWGNFPWCWSARWSMLPNSGSIPCLRGRSWT